MIFLPRTTPYPGPNTGSPRRDYKWHPKKLKLNLMSSVELNKMYKKTLSQTLNSEIEKRSPYNKSLVSYKRWSDRLRPPFRDMAHKILKKALEYWYEEPINLHPLPMEEQVKNVKRVYGKPQHFSDVDRATEYVLSLIHI